jgi:hypothetical protein
MVDKWVQTECVKSLAFFQTATLGGNLNNVASALAISAIAQRIQSASTNFK